MQKGNSVIVVTEYFEISKNEVREMADHIFDKKGENYGFTDEQMDEMKRDFLNGEAVGAETKHEDGRITRSRWKVDYENGG